MVKPEADVRRLRLELVVAAALALAIAAVLFLQPRQAPMPCTVVGADGSYIYEYLQPDLGPKVIASPWPARLLEQSPPCS